MNNIWHKQRILQLAICSMLLPCIVGCISKKTTGQNNVPAAANSAAAAAAASSSSASASAASQPKASASTHTLTRTYRGKNSATGQIEVYRTETVTYDSRGLKVSMITEANDAGYYKNEDDYTYNDSGLLVNRSFQSLTNNSTATDDYTYDADGNLIQESNATYGENKTLTGTSLTYQYAYEFDASHRVTKITQDGYGGYTLTYDSQGRVVQEIHADANKMYKLGLVGVRDMNLPEEDDFLTANDELPGTFTYEYGNNGKLSVLSYKRNDTDQPIVSKYTYDSAGRIIQEEVDTPDQTSSATDPIMIQTRVFSYDTSNRIQSIEAKIITHLDGVEKIAETQVEFSYQ